MNRWVVDAGPLIFLAKLDRLDLLRVRGNVYAPRGVFAETQAYLDEAAQAIANATKTWLQIVNAEDHLAVELLLADLHRGEAEVIVLARELHADWVVLDDMKARRFARRLGLPVVGTVGLLLSAKLRGEIPSLQDEVRRLQSLGFWISPGLVEKALDAAGER